ncbi:hypothetical protein BGX33_006252 [Mortierella sp. NVP41]|nr:hypothetical protein BGX33_006252 [Mortierella sp. NVP41]
MNLPEITTTLAADVDADTRICPRFDSLSVTGNSSTQTLNHAVSVASMQATISGSSQSLQTNLSGCLVDERVYLKQHIQTLDRLRLQEQARHQRIEEGHRQLIADLSRFSRELLGSVNELTCAQAALDEASELTFLTLSTIERGIADIVGDESAVGLNGGHQQDQQQQQQLGTGGDVVESTKEGDATSAAASIRNNNNTTLRQKGLIAASRKELETSDEMASECIKRIRRLAADCVDITELAQGQHHTLSATSWSFIRSNNTATTTGGAGLQRYSFAATAMLSVLKAIPATVESFVNTTRELGPTFGPPITSTATTSTMANCAVPGLTIQGSVRSKESTLPSLSTPSSMFVDGIAFQEFEGHLASVRSSSSSNSSTSESTIFKRAFLSSSASSTRFNSNNSGNINKLNRRNNQSSGGATSAFMRKVLVENIYPCLLIHGRPGTTTTTTVTKNGSASGWMSAFLSSSSSLPPLSSGINNNNLLSPWLQQLLKAMEGSACEIEAWKPSAAVVTTTNTRTSAPRAACCLCGTVHPCEFRLRIVDSNTTTDQDIKPAPPTAFPSSSPSPSSSLQQYHLLDRFCRERIVAVCDFYMFLGHLRQGLLDQPSSLELFRRALGLRQRMAYARVGSMDLVQTLSVELSSVTRE